MRFAYFDRVVVTLIAPPLISVCNDLSVRQESVTGLRPPVEDPTCCHRLKWFISVLNSVVVLSYPCSLLMKHFACLFMVQGKKEKKKKHQEKWQHLNCKF